MTDFLIRSIDPDLLEKLKVRAERSGRSLQAEIKHTLKQSVKLSKSESLELLKRLRDEVPYSPIDSTQLIREDRDSR
jgi:plasmid stability protein